ncbi:hypothetical protein B0H14DRAFT_2637276 [Mycena olivaceomarginata]|nr:hypothetical protein B0H14DRAFT_2637276 [Mycena olivaceomarginata]
MDCLHRIQVTDAPHARLPPSLRLKDGLVSSPTMCSATPLDSRGRRRTKPSLGRAEAAAEAGAEAVEVADTPGEVRESLGTWIMANLDNQAGSSRGGAGSTVSHTPDDGAPVFSNRQATRGRRELREEYPVSRDTPGQEQRPAAMGSVRHQATITRKATLSQSVHRSQWQNHTVSRRGAGAAPSAVSEKLATNEAAKQPAAGANSQTSP